MSTKFKVGDTISWLDRLGKVTKVNKKEGKVTVELYGYAETPFVFFKEGLTNNKKTSLIRVTKNRKSK